MPRPPSQVVHCLICLESFAKPRSEQRYCSKACGGIARSQRARIAKRINGKRCSKCRQILPIGEFYSNAASYDGLKSECKQCAKIARIERMSRVQACDSRKSKHRETLWKSSARFIAKKRSHHSNASIEEWIHHLNQRIGTYGKPVLTQEERDERKRNRRIEKIKKYHQDSEYRDKCLEKARQDHQKRPWVMLARKHSRDARMAGVLDDGSVTVDVVKGLWSSTDYCVYCGRCLNAFNKSLEHMIPMSLGGNHSIGNILVVCRLCNETKRNKPFDEWICMLHEPWRSITHSIFIQNFSRFFLEIKDCG